MKNPEVKALWINALLIGAYPQGRGELRSTDGSFCCFGVLCDLYNQHGYGRWVADDGFIDFVDERGERSGAVPTDAVREWAGLSMREVAELMDLGDGNSEFLPMTFPQLAKYIDTRL